MRLIIATVVKLSIVVTIEKALKNQYKNLLNVFFFCGKVELIFI